MPRESTPLEFEVPKSKQQRQLLAALFARLATYCDQTIDEVEAFELCEQFMEENPLTIISIDEMAQLVRATRFDPSKNLWH